MNTILRYQFVRVQSPRAAIAYAVYAVLLLLFLFGSACKPKQDTKGHNRIPPQRSIIWAAMMGDLDLLKKLEVKGESLNAQDQRVFNWPPLTAAIYHEQTNIIDYLLSRNVNVNLQDRDGETPLIWAIRVRDTNTVRLLLLKGADVTITNKNGITALGYAETSEFRSPLVEWLEKALGRRGDAKP